MSWEEKTLDELGDIGRGKSRHRPRNDERLYGGTYPFIQTSEIQKANLYINSFEKTYSDFGLAQSKLWNAGTLCISIVGANTAESAILGIDACFPDSVIGFNAYKDVADNHFVKYHLDTIKLELKRISEGAARENLSMEKLLSKKRPFPPYKTQKKIASILSAYDDLIENNLKRIKLLEEAAQNIYKEWFVNFRFPGWEKVKFDKEKGLPEGWRVEKVEDYFEFIKGIEVGSKNYKVSESVDTVPFLRVGDIGSRNSEIFVLKSLVGDKILNEDDVIISMDGSIGKVGFFLNGAYSTGLRKVVNKKLNFGKSFIYCLLCSEDIQNTVRTHAKGTTILHASSSIQFMTFIKPTEEIIRKFNSNSEPIFLMILSLKKQNQKLKEARDILLPRLMNGMIEV